MYRKISDLSLFYKPHPAGSVSTKKTSIRYFSQQTLRSLNKKFLLTECEVYTEKYRTEVFLVHRPSA
jgi:hypothetical protein